MNNINPENTKEYLTKNEFNSVILDLKQSILSGFDRVFHVMDENTNELRKEFKKDIGNLRLELKGDILDLRREINQRFLLVDNRLLSIEDNMVHKHEFKALDKRVRLLEV